MGRRESLLIVLALGLVVRKAIDDDDEDEDEGTFVLVLVRSSSVFAGQDQRIEHDNEHD